MDMAWNVAENGQADVNEDCQISAHCSAVCWSEMLSRRTVSATACDDVDTDWRQQYCENDQEEGGDHCVDVVARYAGRLD